MNQKLADQQSESKQVNLKSKIGNQNNFMPLVKVPKPKFIEKLKRFFMVDLVKGLGLTLKYNIGAVTDSDSVGGKGIYTEQYPKVRPDVAPRFHGAPRLNMDPETHDTLCIACNLCAIACPEDCIDVLAMDVEIVVAGKPRKKKVLDEFIFDTSRCMFCALVPGSLSDVMPGTDTGLRVGHLFARRLCLESRDARAGTRNSKYTR